VPVVAPDRTHSPFVALAVAPCLACAQAASPAQPGRLLEEITVSATPLGGFEFAADRISSRVQSATSKDIERVPAAGLSQFLDRQLASVFVNEAQANPLQPDVQFRGFIASPLLGTSQGMAVYQDGVRINDPFGDVVSWALVPETAIARIELVPGSNAVFGLNTLGGALSIRTKNGFTDPGLEAELLVGSYERVVAEAQAGGAIDERWSYYVGARYLTEDGWRQFSPTDALQVFSDLGWRRNATELHLNVTRVETDLIGNGPAPVQLLELDRESIYTHPDETKNSLFFVTLGGNHRFASADELQGVVYVRRSDIDTLNGDESIFEACEDDPGFVCEEGAAELALDPQGRPIEFEPAVDGAMLNHSATQQDTYGAAVQYGMTTTIAGRENHLILGGTADRSKVRFGSGAQLGQFDDQRGVIPSGVLAGETFVGLETQTKNWSAFFTDTLALTSRLDLTLSGRYNDSSIELEDQIGSALDGNHDFHRFNGAAGLSYRVDSKLRVYASYSESNRAPTAVELTCADPEDPCALPNAFLSDPPLEQVIAKTIEMGADGSWRSLRWHAGLFRITNDDILFISAGALTNTGFFDNVGQTRRQGIEISLSGALPEQRFSWFAHYTGLAAEFRNTFSVSSPHNPAAVDGEIEVRSGSRIPGIPDQQFKAGVNVQLKPTVGVSLDLLYQSNQFLRGDEGNLTEPLSGFTTVNLGSHWELKPGLLLFAQIDNVLDREYATFGVFGDATEVLGEQFDDGRFISPGAPRSVWLGLRCSL
jgi:iron complex outermembrane recepter protein